LIEYVTSAQKTLPRLACPSRMAERAVVALPRRNDVGVLVGAGQMECGIGEDWLVVEWPTLTADRSEGDAARHARAPCS
jgi:hypothetical protein